jgi:hypothetical protein
MNSVNSVYDGDYNNLIKIGEITGDLILCKQMLYEGENPWVIFDDLDGDFRIYNFCSYGRRRASKFRRW